jgi:hypothetical protein
MMRLHFPAISSSATLAVFIAGAAAASSALAAGQTTYPLYGQWQSSEPVANFSARGKLYRTIDIAPCGPDTFCGVSVGAKENCGQTLFRFYIKHLADGDTSITGHASWGDHKEAAQIWFDDNSLNIMLAADSATFTERSGSVPIFTTEYHKTGESKCTAPQS